MKNQQVAADKKYPSWIHISCIHENPIEEKEENLWIAQ
jgi:hypothetical protein